MVLLTGVGNREKTVASKVATVVIRSKAILTRPNADDFLWPPFADQTYFVVSLEYQRPISPMVYEAHDSNLYPAF